MEKLIFVRQQTENESSPKACEKEKEYFGKRTSAHRDRIVKIMKYPDDATLRSAVKRHGENAGAVMRGLTDLISDAHYRSDFFCVVMYDGDDQGMIGYASFFQSSREPSKWLYGDLWVEPEHRRRGAAAEIVSSGWRYLSEVNAKTLLCTVEPENTASLNLQQTLGFEQVAAEPFEQMEVDGLLMFRKNIPMNFNMVPLADDSNHLGFVCDLLTHPANAAVLHLRQIPDAERFEFYKEIRKSLIFDAADAERNYIVRKGVVPIAWLGLGGFSGDDMRIDSLIVHEKYRGLGAGMFALHFAEEIAASTKRKHIYAGVAADNMAAQAFYRKAGYAAADGSDIETGGECHEE